MPIATGGGSKPKKPPKPSPDPSARPAGQSQRIGRAIPNPPPPPKPYTGTETGLGGNTGISQAAKEARQARQSEAKHAVRRRLESKRESVRAGARTKVMGEEEAISLQNRVASRRATARAGGRTKYAAGDTQAARTSVRTGASRTGLQTGAGSRSTVTRTGGTQTTRGGSSFGDAKPPRTVSYDGVPRRGGTEYGGGRIGGTDPIRISEGRIGGGFKEFGSGYRPPPAYFDTGGAGGGGAGGGGANPLAGGANFSGESLDEVLHGAKKKGRVKRARRTE